MRTEQNAIDQMANKLMVDVARMLAPKKDLVNYGRATDIMREEFLAFISGDKYSNQRELLRTGAMHEGYIWADFVTECVSRILEARS